MPAIYDNSTIAESNDCSIFVRGWKRLAAALWAALACQAHEAASQICARRSSPWRLGTVARATCRPEQHGRCRSWAFCSSTSFAWEGISRTQQAGNGLPTDLATSTLLSKLLFWLHVTGLALQHSSLLECSRVSPQAPVRAVGRGQACTIPPASKALRSLPGALRI